MNRRRSWIGFAVILFLGCVLAATPASSVAPSSGGASSAEAADDDWHVAADVAESCSCDVSCP